MTVVALPAVDAGALAAAKRGRSVTVCIPARDEAATVGPIVGAIGAALGGPGGLVDEVLVVDDGSVDGTAEVARAAGARVVASTEVLPEAGPGRGKGEAMWKGVAAAEGDLVVFVDADLRRFDPTFVSRLLEPLLRSDDIALVKAFYERPLDGDPRGGGRVTELVARPLISLLFPHLAAVRQPLGGECAAPREVLEQIPFAQGYGVELGMLVDVAARFGAGAIAQVDLGVRHHRNRPIRDLAPQATEIMAAALARSGRGRPAAASLARPGADPVAVVTGERPPLVEVPAYRMSA